MFVELYSMPLIAFEPNAISLSSLSVDTLQLTWSYYSMRVKT